MLLIDGNAGDEVGCIDECGLIAVGGGIGDLTAMGMIAGSVFVFGEPGIRSGAGMKRGTLAFFGPHPGSFLPTFRFDCEYRPVFLLLYLRQLRTWGFPAEPRAFSGLAQRYSGDLMALGKGEVLFG